MYKNFSYYNILYINSSLFINLTFVVNFFFTMSYYIFDKLCCAHTIEKSILFRVEAT